jgi:hypothetical protein
MSLADWWPKIGAQRMGINPDTEEQELQEWVTDGYGCWWQGIDKSLEKPDTENKENKM